MVLEALISANAAEKEPWEMFFVGMLYAIIAIFLGLFVFGKSDISMIIVFLTVLASTMLMYDTLKVEALVDKKSKNEKSMLKHHARAVAFFVFLFLGFVVTFTATYIFLPSDLGAQVFETQISTIKEINSPITGQVTTSTTHLFNIFFNNLRVLFFALLFSFFYGTGAIFILTWNASVIGVAAGMFMKNILAKYLLSSSLGVAYVSSLSAGLLRYLIHGIPEMAAYFIGGLAGGIISYGVIHKNLGKKTFSKILQDASTLVVISVLILAIAALMEVYLTPLFF